VARSSRRRSSPTTPWRGAEVGLSPGLGRTRTREVLDAGREAVRIARAAGVRIDSAPTSWVRRRTSSWMASVCRPRWRGVLPVLRAAMSVNADLIGRPDLGRVAPGCAADLLVLDGDPLTDSEVLWARTPGRRVARPAAS
jgi:imidazolonepropionase-like amidohydrolase